MPVSPCLYSVLYTLLNLACRPGVNHLSCLSHRPPALISAHHKPLFHFKTAFHKPRRRGAIRKPISSARLQWVRDRQLPSPARMVHRRQAQSTMAPAGLYKSIRLIWVLLVAADLDVDVL